MIFNSKIFPVFSILKDGDITKNIDMLYDVDKDWMPELHSYKPVKSILDISHRNLTYIRNTMIAASENIFYVSNDLMSEMQSEIEGYNTLFDSDYKRISQYCKENMDKCLPMPCVLIWNDNKQRQHVNIFSVTENKTFAMYMYCRKIVSIQINNVDTSAKLQTFKTARAEFKDISVSAMPLMVIANMIKLNNKYLWQWKVEIEPCQSLRLTGHLMPFVNKTPYTINFI